MLVHKCLAALALLPALLFPLYSQADPLYTLHFLPEGFYPANINNAGQIAGTLYGSDSTSHAALYANGAVNDLGTFGGTYSDVAAMTEAGAVLGNFATTSGEYRAFVYSNGSTQEIAGLYANGINASGDIVGHGATGAAVYRQGTITELGHLGTGDFSTARAINDTGHIVGTSTIDLDVHSRQHPFLYRDGSLHDLGTLDEREFNSAVAINNAGQIAGYSEGVDGGMHAFFYENGVMTDLGSFGGKNLDVRGMNEHGDIVGYGNTWDGPDVGFVSRDGVLVDLNTLIDPALGWAISDALDINDHGQIIASACRDFVCAPVRLDLAGAVPEPGGALAMLCGLILLASAGPSRLRRAWDARRPASFPTLEENIMLKRVALCALLSLPALATPVSSQAAPLYTVTQYLDNFTAYDINNGGQMAGALAAGDGTTHAALYTNGAFTDLGNMGGNEAYATAVNDAGAMTGTVFTTAGEWHGFVYSNGVTTDLGRHSEGFGINAHGDAVGRAWTGDGTYSALLYSDGQLHSLGSLGTGEFAIAYDVNDIGQAVGFSLLLNESHAPFHPFLYSDGAMRDLGSLAYGGVSSANAINNAGRIAGYSEDIDGTYSAFIYENATMTFLGNLGGSFVDVGGINEQGDFVGNADNASYAAIGYIYLDGALVDLNTLLDPALGWQIDGAVGINDSGQIAAHGCRNGLCGTVRLDLASAVPEPAAAGMLVPGLLALAVWRRKRGRGTVAPGMSCMSGMSPMRGISGTAGAMA